MSPPKQTRPPLRDVDLDDLPGAIAAVDDAELRRRAAVASSFEDPAFVARGADAGHIRLVRAGAEAAAPAPAGPSALPGGGPPLVAATAAAAAPARKLRSEEPNFTVRLPDYVQQALRMRAVSQRTTVRLVLLRLLRDAGYEVDDADMTDDRGIVAKTRARARQGP